MPFKHKLDQKPKDVSVVIATLGGESLFKTIERLNRGTVIPSEVIVCIPETESGRLENIKAGNVRVVATSFRGQVAQRAYGFKQAEYEYVLQLDDDILVREDCIEKLLACMNEIEDIAIGPKLYDARTREYYSFLTPTSAGRRWYRSLLFWIINGVKGYEPGQISRCGVGMGVPEQPGDWGNLGWLPGGCVLHRKKNLVLYDFYPFTGKAFIEDLFHSIILRKNNIRLMRCGEAACDVDLSSSKMGNVCELILIYRGYTRALKRLIEQTGRSKLRLYLYLVTYFFGTAVKKLLNQRFFSQLHRENK